MSQSATQPRLVLFLKSSFAHQGGFALYGNPPRWHKIHGHKPAPKGAPVSAHPHAAGVHGPVVLTDEQVDQLKYPADKAAANPEMAAFNEKHLPKLLAHAASGDATAIVGSKYGTNTHSKKQVAIANYLLAQMGSTHVVSVGQGAGWHAAVEHAPAEVAAQSIGEPLAEPVPVTAPGPAGLVVPEFVEGKTVAGVKAHYEKVAAKIMAAVAAGDAAALQALPTDKGSTWAGKTPNSKKMLAFHEQALAAVQGGAPAAAAVSAPPAPEPVAPAPEPEPAPTAAAPSNLDLIPWDKLVLPDTNTNAGSHNKKVAAIKAAAYAGDVGALEAMKFGTNTYAKKQALLVQTAIAALKEQAPPAAAAPAPAVAPAPAPVTDDALVDWLVAWAANDSAHSDQMQAAWDALPDDAKKPLMDLAHAKMDAKPGSLASTAGAAPGPQDGDTKPGADGATLVFKDGRWHKQAEPEQQPEPAAPTGVEAVAIPDFQVVDAGNWAAPYAKVAAALKALVLEKGAAGLKGVVINHADGRFTINLAGYKLKKVGPKDPNSNPAYTARRAAMHKFVTDLKAAAGKPVKAKVPKPAGAGAAPSDASTAGLPSIDSWAQTGAQGGSNPGGRFKDEHGVEWYCKFPKDADIARSEVLAAKLYEAAGVKGQDAKLITKDGKIGIASRWVGVKKGSPADLHGTPGALSGFAVDAWLANHDVVGMAFDNLQIGDDGRSMRVDAGGSLEYRAQGAKKAFGPTVGEIDSMRDASIAPQAAAVFGGMTNADLTASAKKVLGVSDEKIFDLVMEYGPGTGPEKAALIDTLIARKDDLAKRFPKAVPKEKVKAKPDPTKLKVSADQLPKPHDFMNFGGKGSPLSSKAHVNEANAKTEQELLDFALKGNLVALKDYHYEAVDKETGASLGSKPISEYPSQHVKLYWSDLVSTLSYIANPPEALKKFKSVVATSITKVSQAFKSAKYGTTTKAVDANSRLAFWIALGSVKPIENLLPPGGSLEFQSKPAGQPKITPEQVQQAKDAYQALASNRPVKRFINGIQSSGTYNDNFRDGRMVTTDGHDAVGMTLDAYSYATEKPEGFELYKWISFPGDMAKEMLAAPAGTVFQNPGSMCCSTGATSTQGFGPDRIRIRYANGAKAVDSFGSGNFAGEKEITTLPGQRFVILKCHKVMDPVKGKERIELDILMLPPDPTYVAELETMKGKHGPA